LLLCRENLKNMLFNFLKKIHYLIPPKVQIIYMFPFNIIRKFKYCLLPVYLCTGKKKKGQKQLNIAYMGWDNRICFHWMERLLGEAPLIIEKGKIPVWKVYKHLTKNKEGYDSAVIEMNSLTRIFARRGIGFLLPRWFEMELDSRIAIKKDQEKDIKRRIRKNSLTFKKNFPKKDIRFFHERMFIPFIGKRHGESAVICDYEYFLNKFRKKGSMLNFILKDGIPVAGSLTELIGRKLRLTGLGIIDGREDIMRMGVIGAIYYFELQNAVDSGMPSINVGGTSPFLTDGLTKYKLSLGAQATDIKYFIDLTLWFTLLKDSDLLRNRLKDNPFIQRIKNNLFRVIFINPLEYEEKAEFIRLLRRTDCNNLKGTKIFCFSDPDKITGWINEEGYRNFQVLNFNIS
jgi:hypothetical protein